MLGEDSGKRLLLTVDNAILAPTSSGYHLAKRGGDPRLLVVLGTRRGANAGHRGPTQRSVVLGEDGAERTSWGPAREAARAAAQGPSSAGQQEVRGQDPSAPEGGGMLVEAHVEDALARIMAAASPPAAGQMEGEGEGQERRQRTGATGEEDDGLQITGARRAHEVERGVQPRRVASEPPSK